MPSDPSVQLKRLESRLLEAFDDLWDTYVDPREAFSGEQGEWWSPVGAAGGQAGAATVSLPQLDELRRECRRLALTNEFAINGHENRISYVVGSGHVYHATIRNGVDAPTDVAQRVQEVVDRFLAENDWHERQQEMVRRLDRDGEVFLRYFSDPSGGTRVRFLEPEQVEPPA